MPRTSVPDTSDTVSLKRVSVQGLDTERAVLVGAIRINLV